MRKLKKEFIYNMSMWSIIQRFILGKKTDFFFCSFADSRMRRALNRISLQAGDFRIFKEIICYDESMINHQFKLKHESILKPGIRGYGYWIWKPFVILDCLSRMKNGDVLLYCDAGCHLNLGGSDRLVQYFKMAKNSEKGMMIFKCFPSCFEEIADYLNENEYMNWRNHQWCKGDLLDSFDLRNNKEFLEDYIVSAGMILVRKCNSSTDIIKRWLEIMENYSLMDDSPSKAPNTAEFIESRHDQSVLSCIAYQENLDSISAYETDAPRNRESSGKNWSALEKYPIHARRDRGVT